MASNQTCWQEVLDDVLDHIRKSRTLPRFVKLKTNEERVDFCLKDEYAKGKVQRWVNTLCSSRHKKYWEKASELRAEGNLCFQNREYEKAVEFYTQSVLAAPFPDTYDAGSHIEELAVGFGNRSAALFHLHRYKACLLDIERAFEYGYPKDLRAKLYLRKGQCLLKLGQSKLAHQAFDEALQHLKQAKVDGKKAERLRKEIETHRQVTITESENRETQDDDDDDVLIPTLTAGSHPTIAYASAAVDMKYNEERGRYIVANRPISVGDTLFVEQPYASVLLPAHYNTHCHHCYLRFQAAVPCHQCSQVRYCSVACCKESWDRYHKWECGNLDLLHSVGIAHLSVRVILVTGLQTLEEFYDRTLIPPDISVLPGCDMNGFYNSTYNAVYHLLTHTEHMHVEDLFQYALTAALLLILLEKMGIFLARTQQLMLRGIDLKDRMASTHLSDKVLEQDSSRPDTPSSGRSQSPASISDFRQSPISHPKPPSLELYVGGLVLRHILQLVCNAHAITELQTTPYMTGGGSVGTQRQVRIATAIYPTASLMNHACDPTIISSFHKNTLIIRVVKDVPTGAEIFNCYGPHFRRMARDDRQRALLEQYFFLCKCEACCNEDEREQRFQALKCNYCDGPLRVPDAANKAACLDCNKEQECAAQLQKVFTAHDLFVQGLQLTAKGTYKDALERLRRCHRIREKVMYCHNRQLAEVQDQIACCYASLGQASIAIDYLRPTLATTEAIYGTNSIELANELQKYSDLLMTAIPQVVKGGSSEIETSELIEEAHQVIERATKIFSIHYGSHHSTVKELLEKKGHLDGLQ
ncbi:SET and MYND domain-containing protein 4-like [Centruroides vittatus]|uniref:SET and MYND domain-containing protein 4-like n=1 Tax=Centruroides vittatus TaxID=120091 RepID=UPI00350F7139